MVTVCLVASGCGIELRTPPAASPPSAVALPADPVAARPNPVLPPPSPDPLVLSPGQTVVTITFDDGRASNTTAANLLKAHSLRGTFFLNSGTIGKPGYLTLPQVDAIARDGHEIAGHTVNHPHLDELSDAEIARQVCGDRDNWL